MKHLLSIIVFVLSSVSSFSQITNDSIFYNKEFKWTVTIPEGFISVPQDSADAIKKRGLELLQNGREEKVEDNTTAIFLFKNNQFNYFESCSQPFDTAVDGNYEKSTRLVSDILYEAFAREAPGAEVDSSFTKEMIGGFEFYRFRMKLKMSGGIVFYVYMYTRLFGKKELAINIYYMDEIKGYQMMHALKDSKFGK